MGAAAIAASRNTGRRADGVEQATRQGNGADLETQGRKAAASGGGASRKAQA